MNKILETINIYNNYISRKILEPILDEGSIPFNELYLSLYYFELLLQFINNISIIDKFDIFIINFEDNFFDLQFLKKESSKFESHIISLIESCKEQFNILYYEYCFICIQDNIHFLTYNYPCLNPSIFEMCSNYQIKEHFLNNIFK